MMTRSSRIALAAGSIALAIATGMGLLIWLSGRASDTGTCHMGWGTGGFSGWGWLMMILMVFFWGLAIWAIFSVIGGWTSKKRDGEIPIHGESALGLLKKRYAAGEITREEYETLRDDLSR